MKHSYLIKVLSLMLSMILGCLSLSVLTISAEETAGGTADEAYEAKKAAWREKLMADDVTTDDLLIGSWVSFYSFETDSYEYQLDQMAAAGINFNIFPKDFGSGKMFDAAYWDDVEEQYAKRNMIYLMNGSLSENLVPIGLEYAAGKEHCVGYHVMDEPTGAIMHVAAEVGLMYREGDKTRYPFTNLLPSYAGEAVLGGTYLEHVSRFVELMGPENLEYLSHDYYPFRDGNVVMTDIFADMEVLRSVAYENGKLKTHAFPQSTAWNGTRMPSIDEMRWNVYGYLAYGFKALSWFNLVCPGSSDTEGEGFRDSLIYRDGTIRDPELFNAWSELNWEVRGLSSILMNLDTAHAYHTDNRPHGVEYLPDDFFLQPGGGRSEFVISVMEPKEGDENYIMIFNKATRKKDLTGSFTVDASSGVKWLEYFDPFIGEYIPVTFEDGMLTDTFRPGEGKLYRLRYDDPPAAETEAPTEEPTEPLTEEPTKSPAAEVTEAPTEAPTSEDITKPEPSKGCSSVTTGAGITVLLVALTAAWGIRKRRTEEFT